MSKPDAHRDVDTEQLLQAAGITVTIEGRTRARRKLADADAYWTDERRAEARDAFLRNINAA